ncbi:SDR family NAD(P)-dependent oxidoreductase [Actinosynnema pretiosum]|uniref:3-oxoacyl-ACP reductase n=1 Tax=Actinosynnema pretiosum TaxID=42197 RepID=A0A290Z4Q2_9PSEU|nr:SDR family oxidoreductase [Actinosynnema pretiosum]ATE53964.1 3-oxoacyl-ACP reductase [Actinosynnema pretiosum]
MTGPKPPGETRGVLVTGASRGIGRATALAFARRGDRVAVHYAHNRADAERTLAELPGGGHVLVRGDLSDPEAAELVAESADHGLGGVDVLVNNAATAPTEDTAHAIAEVSYEHWRRVWRRSVEVNLLGTVDLTHRVVARMVARSVPGRVVNIGSRGAYRGEPDHPAYGATKAALHAFGQSIAVSLAPHGIAVASVAPGFIATERQEGKLAAETGDALRAQSRFGRVGTAEEVAAAVLYLASPEAAWASGAVLDLNGASHLR